MKKIFLSLVISLFVFQLMAQETQKEIIKPALLVIDVQNAYYSSMDQSEVGLAVKMINAYVGLFNAKELPVIYIYHQDKEWGPASDSKEFQFIDEIPVPENAVKVTKHYGNAFNKTDLDKILKEKGVNTVFISGLSATGCVMATTVGAMDLDYNTFWIKNSTMSPDADKTKVMETIFETVGYQTIKFLIE